VSTRDTRAKADKTTKAKVQHMIHSLQWVLGFIVSH